MGIGCSICDARCCRNMLITVTSFDVLRIEKKTKTDPREFSELHKASILNIDWRFVVETEEGSYLLALKSGPCVFLRGKRCSIFEDAPLSCRMYPLNLAGEVGDSICPPPSKVVFKMTKPNAELSKQYEKELMLYLNIVEKANKNKMKKEEAYAFLLEETLELISSGAATL